MGKLRWKLKTIVPYVILCVLAIIFLLPLLWVMVASLDANAMQSIKLPQNWTANNYVKVISDPKNQISFGVGLTISLTQAFTVVVVSLLAAYPLSRYQLKYNKTFMYTILFMNALPITAVMVPVYKQFIAFNLYDKIPGVIIFLTAAALPYGIWMIKNFIDSVPIELEEAAWVDGATTLQCLTKIILPLMFPGICVVLIFTFSGSWGNFFAPYILIQSAQKFTPAMLLNQFIGQHGNVAYGQMAAYSILYSMPSIVLYAIAQKYMSKGFNMAGASKG